MRYAMMIVTSLIVVVAASAQQSPPLKAWDFEKDTQGWITGDKQAELKLCKDAGHVHDGAASLQFSYQPRAAGGGDIPGSLFTGVDGVPGAKAWRFAISSSVGGPLIALLREKNEATYVYMLYVPADQWQVLDIPFGDFHLEDSSKDDDGKLDPEQIAGIGFVDPMVWFLQASAQGSKLPFFFATPSRRDIWLDDVALYPESETRLRQAQGPNGAEAVMLEDCDDDPAYWAIVGGKNLKVTMDSDQTVAGSSLRLDYELPAKTTIAIVRQVNPALLTGVQRIVFSARSGADCKLVVVLEKLNKARYNTVLDLPAGNWRQLSVPLRDLKLEDSSKDPDGGLRPEQVRSVQFMDANAIVADKDMANSLWIDEVMAVK